MTILSAQSIRDRRPVAPFCERTETVWDDYKLTQGLGPAGYDVRLAKTVEIFPNYTFLASTLEWFDMPLDCMAIVHDKSSWARRGLAVQNTVIEPGWRGHLTLELTFTRLWNGPAHLLLHGRMPIAQIVFHLLDAPTDLLYSGKYQDQRAGAQPAQ